MRCSGHTVGKIHFLDVSIRDYIKHEVKQLSKALANAQDADFSNLEHFLKYANQTRDFIFVMDLQVPASDSRGSFLFRLSAI